MRHAGRSTRPTKTLGTVAGARARAVSSQEARNAPNTAPSPKADTKGPAQWESTTAKAPRLAKGNPGRGKPEATAGRSTNQPKTNPAREESRARETQEPDLSPHHRRCNKNRQRHVAPARPLRPRGGHAGASRATPRPAPLGAPSWWPAYGYTGSSKAPTWPNTSESWPRPHTRTTLCLPSSNRQPYGSWTPQSRSLRNHRTPPPSTTPRCNTSSGSTNKPPPPQSNVRAPSTP